MLTAELIAELRSLHRGRGVNDPRLTGRLGPRLRELAGEGESDPTRLRDRLVDALLTASQSLAAEDRTAIAAGFGLPGSAPHRHLEQRQRDLAMRQGCSLRTVQRRLEQAEALLAEALTSRWREYHVESDGWWVERMRARMRLDRPIATVYEERTVVSTSSALRRVRLPFDVPQETLSRGPRLRMDVSHGGRIAGHDHSSRRRPTVIVEFPRPLAHGQRHEFGLEVTVDAGELTRPHYILLPERRYGEVELIVRFDLDRMPSWVRRVEAESVRTFDPPRRQGELLSPDASGEVCARFSRPRPHLGHGIQWGESNGARHV